MNKADRDLGGRGLALILRTRIRRTGQNKAVYTILQLDFSCEQLLGQVDVL